MKDVLLRVPVRATGAALAVVLVMLAVACGGDDDSPAETPVPTGTATATAPATESPEPTTTEAPFDGPVSELRIPRFEVASDIEAIGLIPGQNQLDVPKDPHNTGWYDIYDRPGFGGNSIFSAHVDYYPNIKGPFNRMAEMEEGDDVVVVMEDGSEYRYRVMSNTRYHISEIPTGDLIAADEKPDDEEWITLITCGGDLVRPSDDQPGSYTHRDVVVAARYQ